MGRKEKSGQFIQGKKNLETGIPKAGREKQ